MTLAPILYTITAYPPSIGGAQLPLHRFAQQVSLDQPVATISHWDTHRTDWLLGTTLRAPSPALTGVYEGIPFHRLSFSPLERAALAIPTAAYWPMQGLALGPISGIVERAMRRGIEALGIPAPRLVHNSRVGREGLSLASLRYARRRGIAFIMTPNHHHHWRGWLYRHYIDLYRRADALIVQTEYEREELIRLGAVRERVHIVGIGALLADGEARSPSAGERLRSQLGIPLDAPLILFLGQKYRYKRFSLLLQAMPKVWQAYPKAYALFIGPRTPASQEVFAQVHDERVIELGVVDLDLKTAALAACDVMCMPSSRESYGGVYLEAWAMGKPVIGGDAPAIREVIQDGLNGYIVGDDEALLAERLITLLRDPALRAAYAAAGREIAQCHSWERLTEQLTSVYASLT
ncbi:MAG: glycosyltransferase family 4 protein [Chloroflexi bacterium]|nr:glycosyltransferase family 4 protein [Chloroflexota bacterium]